MTVSGILDRHANINHASRAQFLVSPASRGNSQILDPVKIFIVFPIPGPYLGQIPNPKNTFPDPVAALIKATPFKSHSVRVDSNQKEIEYISASNITAAVETHPPQLHNLLYFSPFLPLLTFYGPLRLSFLRFCDTSISTGCFKSLFRL